MTCQSWRSKKNWGLNPEPHSNRLSGGIFFRLPTLTGRSFGALWAMMMNRSSCESPKLYLFGNYLKNINIVLLRYVTLSWKVPIYYINRALMIFNHPPLYSQLSSVKEWSNLVKMGRIGWYGWLHGYLKRKNNLRYYQNIRNIISKGYLNDNWSTYIRSNDLNITFNSKRAMFNWLSKSDVLEIWGDSTHMGTWKNCL